MLNEKIHFLYSDSDCGKTCLHMSGLTLFIYLKCQSEWQGSDTLQLLVANVNQCSLAS